MITKSNIVYCDEAGFTGDNLLDTSQRHFVFSSTNLSKEDSEYLITKAVVDFGLQGNEIKGRNLIRHRKGQDAISWMLESIEENLHFVVNNKPYSLACRFFEWTFSEIFAGKNMVLYINDFHRFISNALFAGFVTSDFFTGNAFSSFQDFMRSKENNVSFIKSENSESIQSIKFDSVLNAILMFCHLHKEKIGEVIIDSKDEETEKLKWYLDLSIPSLHSSLCFWGERFESIRVVCDDSKPLKEKVKDFDIFINRTEHSTIEIGQFKSQITYNLEEIKFEESHLNASIQIADIFASALCYALDSQDNTYCSNLIDKLLPRISVHSVMPDLSNYFDLNRKSVQENYFILMQMLNLSLEGKDARDKLIEIVVTAKKAALENVLQISNT